MIPAIMEPMRKTFAASFDEAAAEAAMEGVMKSMLVAQLVIEPVFTFFRWMVFTGILCLLCLVFADGRAQLFRRLLSIVSYSEVVFILMSVLTLLVVYAKGIDSIQSIGDLAVFRGLDYFLKVGESNAALATILNNINPFSVWYVVIIICGVSVVTELQKSKAIIVASVSWVAWIAVNLLQSKAMGVLLGLITGQN